MASKTTRKIRRTGVVLALGLSACDPGPTVVQPEQDPPNASSAVSSKPEITGRETLNESVRQSLLRLNALQLFTANGLVMKLPASARACYGLPCPENIEDQAAYDTELARQAMRLSKLADQAESCNSGNCYISTPNSAEEAVQALNALEIVQVESLLLAQPQNNPRCYNLPCEWDVQAANRENERRATMALTIANHAKGL